MTDVQFLDLNDILAIHADTVAQEGGGIGIRDIALLESAVASPRASYDGEYLHPDLPSMAAALMFSLISNHGFVDGNKRVGTLAALVFLDVNEIAAYPPASELEIAAMSVARGEMTKEQLTVWWAGQLA